ncbi:hypothetical protein B7494_g2477 [Chlorociboria aeruginascens]|nr:hypothetical protein B7494_g2477 [Chlorociboria aeruginascens]
MISSLPQTLILFVFITFIYAQTSTNGGYVGYNLSVEGDPDSAIYETADTTTNATISSPDVFLNASVYVGEIDILVSNLTAKVNLDVQVLELLNFNAGVDVSIDRVTLTIQNISAHVLLEARLENVVIMIDDVLSSLDLNPILATLGQDLSQIVNTTVGDTSSSLTVRSFDLENNILYSVNDYSGNTHTNRILSQSGTIIDQQLDNDSHISSFKVVGTYDRDMRFDGHNVTVEKGGVELRELGYVYNPFPGLSVVSRIFLDGEKVVETRVLSESGAGGTSSIGGEL